MLEAEGYSAHTAPDGVQALEAYRAAGREPYDLVLSDVYMPNLDGPGLARRLVETDPNVNILFMSGQAGVELTQTSFSGRYFDLLAKPFRREGLLRSVRAALERRGNSCRLSVVSCQ